MVWPERFTAVDCRKCCQQSTDDGR